MNNQKASRIVPAMIRTLILLALIVLSALPVMAQANEFGVVIGGSRRFVEGAPSEEGEVFDDSTFSFSNNTVDLYWAIKTDEDVRLKFKVGRIQGPVAIAYQLEDDEDDTVYRRDTEGTVQHGEVNVEYRFDEPFGSTSLFGGFGLYRIGADDADSSVEWGFNGGVNADFPITARYGVVMEATYHFVRGDFNQRFLTAGLGLRVGF